MSSLKKKEIERRQGARPEVRATGISEELL
jgi:hypothetical protein